MKKLLWVILVVLLVVGCGGKNREPKPGKSSNKHYVCTYIPMEDSEWIIDVEYGADDKIIKILDINRITVEADFSKGWYDFYSEALDSFKDVRGMSGEVVISDDKTVVTRTITIDYSQLDYETLESLNLPIYNIYASFAKANSAEMVRELHEETGYNCVER